MSLLSNPEINPIPTSSKELIHLPDAAMQPFTPGQCLFCPNSSPSFVDSVLHMQKSHGLFVPKRQNLLVDLEALFKYLHLVIFGYRECLQCGTERATVQAVQQHMTGKGHCKFDILEEDSEFAEFYESSEPEDESESDDEGEGDVDERNQERTTTSSNRKLILAKRDSIRLPSGKIISRQSSSQAKPSLSHGRRQNRKTRSLLENTLAESDDDEEHINMKLKPNPFDIQVLSNREKRQGDSEISVGKYEREGSKGLDAPTYVSAALNTGNAT
ncbi:putative C2H2 type zinc-finger-domain-containing protein [Seiridium cardinale]|uniref:C2H2 type zinc-finger-domain-containing protein n=1 Tax=Seiridium cardinale TaxID=138064 RepID=A0ABR2Y2L5_9PEZI